MKKKWFRTMDLVNDEYLAEADPGQRVIPFRKKRVVTSVLASCACLALLLTGMWLFWPADTTPPDAKPYQDNAYYPVIQQLSMLTWEQSEYNNNFQKFMANFSNIFGGVKNDAMDENFVTDRVPVDDAVVPEAPGASNSGTGGVYDGLIDGVTDTNTQPDTYEEITDNQVEGITEADRIKRSSTHIYYLDGNTLRVFSIAGLDSEELGHFELLDSASRAYIQNWEFYLSEDCKTATVITLYPMRISSFASVWFLWM